MTEVRIRLARPADAQAIHDLVVGLAVYEKEPDAVEGGPEDFASALFCDAPQVFCHVAEVREACHMTCPAQPTATTAPGPASGRSPG